MAEPSIVLVPNGDLLIIVSALADRFAVWYEFPDASATQGQENGEGQDNEDNETIESVGIIEDEAATTDTSSERDGNVDDDGGDDSSSELRIKASSSHLALASKRFGRMLANAWPDLTAVHAEDGLRHWATEAVDLAAVHAEDGLRHWATEAVDLAAFAVVMDVVHGRNRSVPRALDLETLAKVAVVVDDLQCHEAVEVFADMWIGALGKGAAAAAVPYSRELVLWTLVASVFHHADIFEACTRTAIRDATGPMPSLGLPIRGKIIERIEARRLESIDHIIASLYDLFESLRDGKSTCSFECESILLGALMKQMHSSGLLYPRPSKPYAGLSVSMTTLLLRSFQTPNWSPEPKNDTYDYDQEMAYRFGYEQRKSKKKKKFLAQKGWSRDSARDHADPNLEYEQHECGFQTLLVPKVNSWEAGIRGLDLESDLGYTQGCV